VPSDLFSGELENKKTAIDRGQTDRVNYTLANANP